MRKLLRLLIATLTLVLVLTITTPINAQAELEVTNLTISPESTKVGDTITITATVKNKGDEEDAFTLTLKIDDRVIDTKEITLAAGASETVEFTVTANTPGLHTADLNGSTRDFTVKEASFWAIFPTWLWIAIGIIMGVLLLLVIVLVAMPSRKKQPAAVPEAKRAGRPGALDAQAPTPIPTPFSGPGPTMPPTGYPTTIPTPTPGMFPSTGAYPAPGPFPTPGQFPTPGPTTPYPSYSGRAIFSVSNLTITPNQVKAGEPITISAIVSNNGSEAGRYSVVLRINGLVENITELALPPGGSQSTTFTVIKDIGGDYYTELDGLGGTFIVIPLVPANFSVSNLLIAPERVKQGENITISAIVTNNGEISGDYSLVLKLKGVTESVEEVSLGPGESRRVAFNIIKTTPGFYNVELEGLTGRFVVEMEWQG